MFYMLNFPINLLSEVIRAEAETCLKLKMKIDILMLHLHLMIFALVHTKVRAIQNTTFKGGSRNTSSMLHIYTKAASIMLLRSFINGFKLNLYGATFDLI